MWHEDISRTRKKSNFWKSFSTHSQATNHNSIELTLSRNQFVLESVLRTVAMKTEPIKKWCEHDIPLLHMFFSLFYQKWFLDDSTKRRPFWKSSTNPRVCHQSITIGSFLMSRLRSVILTHRTLSRLHVSFPSFYARRNSFILVRIAFSTPDNYFSHIAFSHEKISWISSIADPIHDYRFSTNLSSGAVVEINKIVCRKSRKRFPLSNEVTRLWNCSLIFESHVIYCQHVRYFVVKLL